MQGISAFYLFGELVVLVENGRADKAVAVRAQVVDAPDGHGVAVEAAAVHPQQQRVFLKLCQVDARRQHAAAVAVQAAGAYDYFFCHLSVLKSGRSASFITSPPPATETIVLP